MVLGSFCGFERGSKKCFLVLVVSRGSDVLLEVIKKWVRLGTTIISDCWKAYNCLASEGYTHLSVNHSVNFVDPRTRKILELEKFRFSCSPWPYFFPYVQSVQSLCLFRL